MKIGRLEIRWIPLNSTFLIPNSALNEREMEQAFRVPADEPWFAAVLQVIGDYERETIQASRQVVANPELCISAVSNGEAAAIIAERLERLRAAAVAGVEKKG